MMINKRLIENVSDSKKYIAANVAAQWCSLAANIVIMAVMAKLLGSLYKGTADSSELAACALGIAAAVVIRFICAAASSRMSYLSSKTVKKTLRSMIYRKLLRLGNSYKEKIHTSEIVQVTVEGVDQLETYFGAYLPQFFYSMLAPLTLFVVLSFVNFKAAVVLLICVPLIPVTIAAVQTWAKKLLAKYWGQYTALGDTFLENLQGMTTLKIYQADEFKHIKMNEESEKFRKITMKVLSMQLNSITVMDIIAYGGAALGIIVAVMQYRSGYVSLEGCILIILLSADFFIPMRQLGSFFHIAMNGMAASDKIFRLLDLPEEEVKTETLQGDISIKCRDLKFSYDGKRQILCGINMNFNTGSFTAVVGESGCGKSTVADIFMCRNKGYSGTVLIGDKELSGLSEESVLEKITYISHQSYIFKGTVMENLLMGKPDATQEELWEVLGRVKLDDFLSKMQGLDTVICEKASNLSGGQRQRLALARALLHNSDIYIFDEATSNIDVESENDIMEEIYRLAKTKTVILISHRLANVTRADNIYVMEQGRVAESGSHEELLAGGGFYSVLWNAQQRLENYGKEVCYEQ